MDKYVIRKPRTSQLSNSPKKKAPKKVQAAIEDCSRVVVVEHIQHAASVLSVENQSAETLIKTMTELNKRTPSKEVLLETKIGHVVNKLRNHSDENVKKIARVLLRKWKSFYKHQAERKPIEVRCNAKTELFRKKAKGLIASSLQVNVSLPLVDVIERSAYMHNSRATCPKYRRIIRTVTIKLQNNDDLRKRVLSNELSPEDLFKEVMKS